MSLLRTAPRIRETKRSADEIAADVIRGLELGPKRVDPLSDAIARIFARYAEILIERLNRVPETHHLAFLGLLGAAPVPAVPARVPLSFKAVEWAGKPEEAPVVVVPAFTQVAAPPANGETEPVVFETTADLELTRAELVRAVAADMSRQLVAAADGLVSVEGLPVTLFDGAQPIERAVHFAQSAVLGLANLRELRLSLDVHSTGTLPGSARAEWGIPTASGFVALLPERDTTHGLTRSGEVVFRNVPEWPSQLIHGTDSKWLTCRIRQSTSAVNRGARESAYHPTRIAKVRFAATCGSEETPVEAACWGVVPLDVSRDFFPLGERPRFGEVFHVRSQAFATAGARVAVHVKLTNPAGAEHSPIPAVSRDGTPRLQWEVYTRRGWTIVDAADGTRSLIQDGDLTFTVPVDAVRTAVAGEEGGWLRARLISGAYAASFAAGDVSPIPPMTPPAIASIAVSTVAEVGQAAPERIVIEGNLEYTVVDVSAGQPFDPFPADEARGLVLFLGIRAADSGALAGQTLSFHVTPAAPPRRVSCRDDTAAVSPEFRWQARGSTGWRDCVVDDGTHEMRYPGIVKLRPGDDIGKWRGSVVDPNEELFWLRILWPVPETGRAPSLQRLALNAVQAIQAMRLENELLGSSNGRPNQILQTARVPVVGEVTLEVREPGALAGKAPEARDGDLLRSVGGRAAGAVESLAQTWVRWSRVADFACSDMHSRHFTLDPLSGAVRFGDGARGMIPPPAANNLRLSYCTGGGKRGNRPAATITQLRTTIPYVESVANHEPSTGGQDTEDEYSLRYSAAAWLRHRDRAVCADDYADLARRASPEVAKAMCVAARDLGRDSLSREAAPGVVSVVVLTHGVDSRPQPSFALVRRVKEFLDARRPVGAELVVLGPEYVSIEIEAEIAVTPERSPAEAARECECRLGDFLHPVSGGPDRLGWEFGQQAHASDFYPVLGAVKGVDHIRWLRMRIEEDRPGLLASGAFLICAGRQKVRPCR